MDGRDLESSSGHDLGNRKDVFIRNIERLRDLLQTKLKFAAEMDHIWWGVSVENQKHSLPRIDHLREANPKMAFLSVEPLLEDLGEIDLAGIDWVIVGGESGAGARPMKSEWGENIQRQCESAHVPFFFKQWGGVRKKLAGRELNGRTYDEHPPIVRGEMPDRVRRKEMAGEFEIAWKMS